MSLSKEDMYPHVRKKLQEWYPEKRGWKIYARNEVHGIQPDFLIEKTTGSKIERSFCAVEVAKMINEDHMKRIGHYLDILSGQNVAILENILAVPAGTDTSCVPEGISLMRIQHVPEE
jgi:hypothetical protein